MTRRCEISDRVTYELSDESLVFDIRPTLWILPMLPNILITSVLVTLRLRWFRMP